MWHLFLADSSDRHWVGMWWGGFLICGLGLILIAIPFFFFPKELKVRSAAADTFMNEKRVKL